MAITGKITYKGCEFEIQNGRYVELDTGQIFANLDEFDAQISAHIESNIEHVWREDGYYMIRVGGRAYRTSIPVKED